jgi:hypothetical protein
MQQNVGICLNMHFVMFSDTGVLLFTNTQFGNFFYIEVCYVVLFLA